MLVKGGDYCPLLANGKMTGMNRSGGTLFVCWIIYPFIYLSIFVFIGYFCGGENGCRARVPRGSPLLTFVRCLCYFSITLVFSFPRAHLAERMEPILDFLKYSRCLDSLDLVKKRNKENKEQLARGGGGGRPSVRNVGGVCAGDTSVT